MPDKTILTIIVVLLSHVQLFAADWPQWRGPSRDGIWREDGIVEKFESKQLPILWRTEIGPGYSGPTVADGRVYVTDRLTSPTHVERIHCFNAEDGEDMWSHPYQCRYEKVGHTAGPRASVTVNSGRAYSLGTMGNLFCLDVAKGKVLWSKDLRAEYRIAMPEWGIAASPLIEAGLLIVQIGGRDNACLVAFDKVTGREKWTALNDRASYSAPIVIDQADRRVLVCLTGQRVVGLDPATGELLWAHPFGPFKMPIGIAMPVFAGNHIFVSTFYDGSLLLKIDPDKTAAARLWQRRGESETKTDALHCCISTPILRDGYIYGVDSYGELRCLDMRTGDRIWESLDAVPKARWSNIHMVLHKDKVWMFNERGELIMSTLSPEGFGEISRAKLIDPTTGQLGQRGGVCWSHPAYAYKRVYARNDRELVCADLSATQ